MKNRILIYFPDTGGHNFTPPYEALFQAKAIENIQYEVVIVDSRLMDIEQAFEVYDNSIAFIVISTLMKYTSITISSQLTDGKKIEKLALLRNIPVVWTGLGASLLPKNYLHNNQNVFLIKGGNEKSLELFVKHFPDGDKYGTIPSLSGNMNGDVFENAFSLYLDHFTDFGNFSLNAIDISKYIRNSTIDYIATTGCVNSCKFCSVPMIYNKKWQHNTVENIADHLKYLFELDETIRIIHFRDDNMLVNKTFVQELFTSLKDNNVHFEWSCQTSINILKNYRDEEIEMLALNGCRNISVGIESGDEEILEKVTHRKTSGIESVAIIKRLLQKGISVSVTSIINFPFNQSRDFGKTLKFLMKLKLLYPELSMYCTIFQPIPGTELFNEIFGDNHDFSSEILSYNTWTTQKRRIILNYFEEFYFVFNNPNFYKTLPKFLSDDLKLINKIFSPFIRLRFRLGITSFYWEYFIVKNKLKKIKSRHGVLINSSFDGLGIRHLTSNYNYGFAKKDELDNQ